MRHVPRAASFPQIYREEILGGAWVWDEEGQANIDKLRKLKLPDGDEDEAAEISKKLLYPPAEI